MAWMAEKAWDLIRRKPSGACGCFVGATLVWTASGLAPIEEVQVGDWVMARDEATGEEVWREVTDKIVTPGAALLDLTVLHETGGWETIRTTDEHPF